MYQMLFCLVFFLCSSFDSIAAQRTEIDFNEITAWIGMEGNTEDIQSKFVGDQIEIQKDLLVQLTTLYQQLHDQCRNVQADSFFAEYKDLFTNTTRHKDLLRDLFGSMGTSSPEEWVRPEFKKLRDFHKKLYEGKREATSTSMRTFYADAHARFVGKYARFIMDPGHYEALGLAKRKLQTESKEKKKFNYDREFSTFLKNFLPEESKYLEERIGVIGNIHSNLHEDGMQFFRTKADRFSPDDPVKFREGLKLITDVSGQIVQFELSLKAIDRNLYEKRFKLENLLRDGDEVYKMARQTDTLISMTEIDTRWNKFRNTLLLSALYNEVCMQYLPVLEQDVKNFRLLHDYLLLLNEKSREWLVTATDSQQHKKEVGTSEVKIVSSDSKTKEQRKKEIKEQQRKERETQSVRDKKKNAENMKLDAEIRNAAASVSAESSDTAERKKQEQPKAKIKQKEPKKAEEDEDALLEAFANSMQFAPQQPDEYEGAILSCSCQQKRKKDVIGAQDFQKHIGHKGKVTFKEDKSQPASSISFLEGTWGAVSGKKQNMSKRVFFYLTGEGVRVLLNGETHTGTWGELPDGTWGLAGKGTNVSDGVIGAGTWGERPDGTWDLTGEGTVIVAGIIPQNPVCVKPTGGWFLTGKGTRTFSSGETHTGTWGEDPDGMWNLTGEGTVIKAGSTQTGVWGRRPTGDWHLTGEGTITLPNGAVCTGTWGRTSYGQWNLLGEWFQ